jgi:hypothetical protein
MAFFPVHVIDHSAQNKLEMMKKNHFWLIYFLQGGATMGNNNINRNTQKLPKVPENLKSDGIDVEYSEELADQEDVEAQARANAADRRAHSRI